MQKTFSESRVYREERRLEMSVPGESQTFILPFRVARVVREPVRGRFVAVLRAVCGGQYLCDISDFETREEAAAYGAREAARLNA